jgi:hypothetical protein
MTPYSVVKPLFSVFTDNIAALKSATTPAVKQGNLFEKQALTKLVQVQDREKKLIAVLDQQSLVVKEQVNK